MLRIALFLLLVVPTSCSLFDKMKKSSFSYPEQGTETSVDLLVPSGYSRRETSTDSAGNREQLYHYPGGAVLYVALLKDTSRHYQFIDTALHIPRQLANGGLLYKGMDADWRVWKEIRVDNFRLGYHFVPIADEGRFDSSVNYSATLFKGNLSR